MTNKQVVKFGDICKEVKLTTKDPIGDGYERYIGLEHLDSGSLKIKRWGDIAEDNPSFTRVFKKGQILFGKRRPYLKKAALAEFDGICSSDIIVMEPKGTLLMSELLPFVVQSEELWEWAIKNSSGSLSPRTKFKYLEEFNLHLSAADEQVGYRDILVKLNEVISKNETVIISSENLKEVLIEQGLWKQLEKNKAQKRKDFLRLRDVAFVEPGYAFKSKDAVSQGTKWLKIANVGFGNVEWDDESFLPPEFEKNHKRFLLSPGEIVMAMTRPILNGKLKIASIDKKDTPALLNQRVTRIRSKGNYYTNEQLSILMKSRRITRGINTAILGTDPPNISGKEIERLPLPKLGVNEIASVFKRIIEIEKLRNCAKEEQLRVKSIMNKITSNLIRG